MGSHEVTFTLIDGETAEELLKKLQGLIVGTITSFSFDIEKPDIVTFVICDEEYDYIPRGENEFIGGFYEDDGTWVDFEDYDDGYGG